LRAYPGERQNLAESIVGKGLGGAIRMIDAQHFAVGFAVEPGRLIQRIGDGDRVSAVVMRIGGAFAGAVLKAIDLGDNL
jgi:hypothetical protein